MKLSTRTMGELLYLIWSMSMAVNGDESSENSVDNVFRSNDFCQNHNLHECTDEIAVRLSVRDTWLADRLADKHGYENLGQIGELPDYFLFRRKDGRRKRQVFAPLMEDPDIAWSEPQFAKKRVKRDYDAQISRSKMSPSRFRRADSNMSAHAPHLPFPDPLYSKQWYLRAGAMGGFDMRVREAWSMGFTGVGIVTSILDDGIQGTHPDLIANYDPFASKDINDNDDDPTPRDNGDNKHGTRCAGEVSAMAGNSWCGVGIAYNSKIGGVRMLDGPVSDRVEGAALSHRQDHVDIYSASWGPDDDGQTVDGPGRLAKEAFFKGVTEGRRGRGNIFIWASGNGGNFQDSCSCDGYTTSIYTLSVSSATFDNHRPWYLEECPSTLTTTYSSANRLQPAIISTDMPNGCTDQHTGTSASAPIAAGIVALALEANANLTWRDMQHLVVRSSNSTPLLNNPGWAKNGVGRLVSNKFGYGLMNAEVLVKMALNWKTVPPQHSCTYALKLDEMKQLKGKFSHNFTLEVGDCAQGRPVIYLEHVQAVISVQTKKRGELTMTLYSPLGTRSVLLPPRPRDESSMGFQKWPFLSVQQWGENPRGIWTLNVENAGNDANTGVFQDFSLTFYGTDVQAQPSDVDGSDLSSSSVGVDLDNDSASLIKPHEVEFPREAVQPNVDYNAAQSMSFDSEMSSGVGDGLETKISKVDCHVECGSDGCYAPQSAQDCVSCKNYAQYLRSRGGKKCVPKCDVGYYADDRVKRCNQCLTGCSTCSGPNFCDSCMAGTYLVDIDPEHFHHGRCASQCPEGFVADVGEGNVKKCVAVCGVNCLTCESGEKCRYCKEKFFMTPAGQCVPKCPTGFFANLVNRVCEQCPARCEKCEKFSTCDLCATGYVWNSTYQSCSLKAPASCRTVKDCPAGEYCETSDYKCQGCHTDCAECTGPSFDQCTICRNGQPLDSRGRQCMPCNAGQYYSADSGQCLPCDQSCAVCVGSGRTSCIKCQTGYKQFGMICELCCTGKNSAQERKLNHCVTCLESSTTNGEPFSGTFYERNGYLKIVVGVILAGVLFCLLLMGILMCRDRNYATGARKYAYSKIPVRYDIERDTRKVIRVDEDEKCPIVNGSVENGEKTHDNLLDRYLDDNDDEVDDAVFEKSNMFNGRR